MKTLKTQSGILPAESMQSRLYEMFLQGKTPRTIEAYRYDWADFQAFVGTNTPQDATMALISQGHGAANGLALDYRTDLQARTQPNGRNLAAATINRRLAALRSLVKLANVLGIVPWRLDVEGVKSQPYRDTSGPGLDGFKALLAAARDQSPHKAARDVAILRLLRDIGLRRGELVSLDVGDVDRTGGRIAVLGKGRTQKEFITLPMPTKAALAAWLAERGSEDGPLFLSLDRAKKGDGRITGVGIYLLVQRLGEQAGLDEVRPHGLRHLAITTALNATGGDVRAVAKFSRHRDLRVLTIYDDAREDLAGKVAAMVADA